MIKAIFNDKRAYFAGFGAIGGLISAILSDMTEPHTAFSSWVVGIGGNGLFIAAMLAVAQGRYAGKWFDIKGLTKAALIGGCGGVIGGIVGVSIGFPIARMLGGGDDAGRFIGWVLGGIVVGYAVSKVVPNLKPVTASLAGATGGLLGCGLMYGIGSFQVGLATSGAAIGLAIAFAETAFREAWLEVTIGPRGGLQASGSRRTISLEKERSLTVTLGKAPVLFGCGGAADVRLAEMEGAKADFARVSLSGGRVTLEDIVTGKSRVLSANDEFVVSNAKVVLRTKT